MKTAYLQWITLPVSISSYCFVCTQANSGSVYFQPHNNSTNFLKKLCTKNDSSYKFIGEVILKINAVQAEKIKVKVYVNQHESVSHIRYETLMIFLCVFFMNY